MSHKRIFLLAFAVIAILGVGATAVADLGEGGNSSAPAPLTAADTTASIAIDGGAYDPTILTKFIAGRGFVVNHGSGIEEDVVAFNGQTCVQAESPGAGSIAVVFAAVELPDGARIKQIVFYGEDNNAGNITISLYRGSVNTPLVGSPGQSETLVTSFTTAGVTGVAAVASADNLAEVTGSVPTSPLLGTDHRFHIVRVQMDNAAASQHVLCGVEIRYQVPVTAADAGTVYHPINPVRAFDSRVAAYTGAGLLSPNSNRVISIKDGHNAAGAVTAADVVPAGATAITYNITITGPTGPNFVAVTAGDAGSFVASAINFNGTADIANAATVTIDASRQIKVWAGDQGGSAHVIIDVTGYYTPPANMGG
jgi:hypothetical protein